MWSRHGSNDCRTAAILGRDEAGAFCEANGESGVERRVRYAAVQATCLPSPHRAGERAQVALERLGRQSPGLPGRMPGGALPACYIHEHALPAASLLSSSPAKHQSRRPPQTPACDLHLRLRRSPALQRRRLHTPAQGLPVSPVSACPRRPRTLRPHLQSHSASATPAVCHSPSSTPCCTLPPLSATNPDPTTALHSPADCVAQCCWPSLQPDPPGPRHIPRPKQPCLVCGPTPHKTPPTSLVMHNNRPDNPDQALPYRSVESAEPATPPTHAVDMDITHALPKLRPDSSRSHTEPSPAALLQTYFSSPPASRPTSSHRNRSPYARSHLRSRSSGSPLAAPPMARAHSLPTANSAYRAFELSSASPPSSGSLSPSPAHRSPARVRSPFKPGQEEAYAPPPRSPSWYDNTATSGGAIEIIQEDSELDITPRQQPAAAASASFSRSGSLRRRPASPLHSFANAPTNAQQAPTSFPANVIDQNTILNMNSGSASSSPSLGPQKYNEAFPSGLALHHHASNSSFSSISSTPSSVRSRSPSISSLDTIEDVPDLESEAAEEDSQRLKLIAESDEEEDGPRRRSLDVPRGFGFGRNGGSGRERKRWSVCGGERRADLDLETIWED